MKTQINGITIAYSDRGTGLPIVFLHAFPLNRTMWAPQEEALCSQFRIITIDLRGHGESDAPLWAIRWSNPPTMCVRSWTSSQYSKQCSWDFRWAAIFYLRSIGGTPLA